MDTWRDFITLVFWLGLGTLLLGTWRRAALWRQGRSVAVNWAGLLAIPKRYFVDLHDVVAREPSVARAHVAIGGGAVACLLLVAVNDGLRLRLWALDLALLGAALVMLGGAAAMAWRRRNPPSRLSRGAWDRLPYTLGLAAAALVVLSAFIAIGGALAPWLAAVCVLAFAVGAMELALGIGLAGPMKHAVAGLLHLGLHPRPERFAAQPVGPGTVRKHTALQPIAFEQGERGLAKPADLAWNRLLSFDACVQCGKCEAVCPAFAAGQPLNPKKLIQDMVAGMAGQGDGAYRGNPHPGQRPGAQKGAADEPIVPGLVNAETVWSCTTCRACVQACPMLIEHVDVVAGLRRQLTLVNGRVPNKGQAVLQALRDTDTQGRFPLSARYHWAVDLELPVLQPGEGCEWLLLAGESAYELRSQRTLRLFVKTLRQAGITPAVLGAAETDCGDVARRLGDEAEFARLARQLIETLQSRRIKRIVTADPHVLHCLRNEYPALGAEFEVWHHTELLADLLERGQLKPHRELGEARLTLHDPCYLARYNGQTEAPRKALRHIGIKVVEMERCGSNARCCGGGGGAPYTDIPGKGRIPDLRMGDARATGASKVAVACPQCAAMLEGVVGPRPEVVDIAELVAQSMEVAA